MIRSAARLFFTAGMTLALAVGSPALAQTTIGSGGGGIIQSWGKPNTQTYGQTITTPSDNVLQSFSFWLGRTSTNFPDPSNPSLTFRAYVFGWDGTGVTGPALFISGTATHNASPSTPFTQYSFGTGGLALTAGQQYALFFSTSGEAGSGRVQWSAGGGYAGGSLIYANNGESTDFASASFYQGYGELNDMQFEANFVSVPEPGSMLLLASGLLGLGLAGRKRRFPFG